MYNITLESAQRVMKEVSVVSKKRLNSGGLAIPEREVSFATQTISTKEFEGLGITTVDEALQGRIAGLDIISNSGKFGKRDHDAFARNVLHQYTDQPKTPLLS